MRQLMHSTRRRVSPQHIGLISRLNPRARREAQAGLRPKVRLFGRTFQLEWDRGSYWARPVREGV